jgi:hypothetical protein
MAGDAIDSRDGTEVTVPVTASAAVSAGFPVPIGWAMATAAKRGTFGELQLPAVAGLELFEIALIMAVEAQIIAVMTPVPHHDVRMLLRNNQILLLIEAKRRRFIAFMTGVTIKIRKVGFRAN